MQGSSRGVTHDDGCGGSSVSLPAHWTLAALVGVAGFPATV